MSAAKFSDQYRTSFNHTSNTNNIKPEAGTNKSRKLSEQYRTSFNHTSNTNNTKPEAGTNKSREVDQTFFKCKALKLCLGLTELAQEALLRCILKNADSELQS